MRLLRLAWRNAIGSAFRSVAIAVSAALVAGLALTATFVVRGAEAGLRANLERLGADILVLPWGTMTDQIGGARLMSAAIDGWMPREYVARVAALPGVAEVTPQLHVATLHSSPYSSRDEMFVVAYDPAGDFVLAPWLGGAAAPGQGQAIGGAHITLPDGEGAVTLYGQRLELVGRLAPTGTSIDSTLFVSFATAEGMLEHAQHQGQARRVVPGSISAMLVRLELDADPHEVAIRILEETPGLVPLETPNLFQAERRQMIGVLRTLLAILGLIWALTIAFMGLVFAMAVNERRYEIGVLRALGFRQAVILKALLLEGTVLALAGGLAGVLAAGLGFAALGDRLAQVAGLPLQMPSAAGLVSLSVQGQMAALLSVTLAALIPAWRISHQEAAVTMRE